MPPKNDTEALYVQVQRRLVESGEWDRWACSFISWSCVFSIMELMANFQKYTTDTDKQIEWEWVDWWFEASE